MPMSTRSRSADLPPEVHTQPSNRLILCFDGTGNAFQGTPGDTNVVKLYNMFDRNNTSQMHYYQPGIGTYPAEGPVNVSWFRGLMRKFGAALDTGLATSFDSHVIAGYKFVMRYYKPGDRIYIFGFSRGAFTARFLSRMISHIGLLSMGNEELVPFAYKVYEQYEQTREEKPEANAEMTKAQKKAEAHKRFMNSFKEHFCRTEKGAAKAADVVVTENESGIKVHFLGLFDCVSSVGNLDIPFFSKAPPLPPASHTAEHIRHAVAIDEQRVKFKAALFSQEQSAAPEDIKEVWFPGNHGDIGGGWDVPEKEKGIARENKDDDYFQLSDIALKWMIDELDDVEKRTRPETAENADEESTIAWNNKEKVSFLDRFKKHQYPEHPKDPDNPERISSAFMHNTMTKAGGGSFGKILMWNLMEYIPWLIRRWEYIESPSVPGTWLWSYIGWPPNFASRRDIPSTALFHHSVIERMQLAPDAANKRPKLYSPSNSLWVSLHSRAARGSSKSKSNGTGTAENQIQERNLREIAEGIRKHGGLSNGDHDDGEEGEGEGERSGLIKKAPRIDFEYVEELTKGSVAVEFEGKEVMEGPLTSDRVYRVVAD